MVQQFSLEHPPPCQHVEKKWKAQLDEQERLA
jgi:hypothetical protein